MQKVVEGLLVNYEQVGGGKENLVIFTGWKGRTGDWMPVAEKLKDRFKVTVIALPGFGGSSMPPVAWGIFEYADFGQKFLEKLGIKNAVVLGHSFGGRVGIVLAAKSNLVSQLILVDAAGMEIKSLKTKWLGWLKPVAKWLPRSIKDLAGSEDWKNAGDLKPILARVVNQPLRNELAKIKCPTLVVWGEYDKELTLAEAKMLNSGINNSELRIVWGASHWPQQEKFDEFMRMVEEWGV